ncbi:hypothetical protein [uncultured Bacteroides sp.]|uniref:hypothetical protein n=1 Tax=uncultured Bacteroides sp. TaxID=162156 RepID=UPI0027D95187|nr:hypothetical protein [uncultured Bacteroides sp.]
MRKIAGYLTKNRSEKDQKIAQSTHENGYIKTRKTFWRNSKQLLKSEELDKMKIRLSKKLTKDVFSQTDNISKKDLIEQTNLLYGDLSIDKIIVDKGYITITFLAPNVIPDYVINCQLNKRLSIIDYYLE